MGRGGGEGGRWGGAGGGVDGEGLGGVVDGEGERGFRSGVTSSLMLLITFCICSIWSGEISLPIILPIEAIISGSIFFIISIPAFIMSGDIFCIMSIPCQKQPAV